MRRINVRVLLSAAILFLGTVITAQPAAAQGQKSFPEAFRVIGNIYWVGGEYGSYLITTRKATFCSIRARPKCTM